MELRSKCYLRLLFRLLFLAGIYQECWVAIKIRDIQYYVLILDFGLFAHRVSHFSIQDYVYYGFSVYVHMLCLLWCSIRFKIPVHLLEYVFT